MKKKEFISIPKKDLKWWIILILTIGGAIGWIIELILFIYIVR
jgi:hypothetical protein